MDNLLQLHEDLKNLRYEHEEYKDFFINDPKPRHIHKATVRDRVLHHAIHRVLYPFFDKTFISESFSCRIDKGTHKATNRFKDFAYKVSKNNTKTCWILKCDIRRFFDNIDHLILKDILTKYIPNNNVLWLLGKIIDSFCKKDQYLGSPMYLDTKMPNFARCDVQNAQINIWDIASRETSDFRNATRGLPLGNLTSQLFVNIYMNIFDQFVKHKLKVKYYIRYADDFVVLSEDEKWLQYILLKMTDFLKNELRLEVHPKKVFLRTLASGVDFLGFVHFFDHRVLRRATRRRMLKKLKDGPKIEAVQSYMGLLGHGNGYKLKKCIEL